MGEDGRDEGKRRVEAVLNKIMDDAETANPLTADRAWESRWAYVRQAIYDIGLDGLPAPDADGGDDERD